MEVSLPRLSRVLGCLRQCDCISVPLVLLISSKSCLIVHPVLYYYFLPLYLLWDFFFCCLKTTHSSHSDYLRCIPTLKNNYLSTNCSIFIPPKLLKLKGKLFLTSYHCIFIESLLRSDYEMSAGFPVLEPWSSATWAIWESCRICRRWNLAGGGEPLDADLQGKKLEGLGTEGRSGRSRNGGPYD